MSHFPVCSAGPVQLTLTVTAVLGPVHSTQYTVQASLWSQLGQVTLRIFTRGQTIVSAGQCQAVRLSTRLPLTLSGL